MIKDLKASMNWTLKKWYSNSLGFLLLLCLVWISSVHGQTSTEAFFEKANTDYQNGLLDQAIDGYNQILDLGIVNADVYYNLGCAYLKNDQLGKAILYLERAVELKPFNRDFKHNLNIAHDLKEDDFSIIQGFFLIRWLENLANLMSSNAWAILSILLLIIAVFFILSWLFLKNIGLKKPMFIAGLTGFCLFICVFFLGRWKKSLENQNPLAIILQPEIPMLIAPDSLSKEVLTIHEGLKVKIIDQIGDWYKIELSNKEVGWILQSNLERI